jgi:hypothetical protein
VIFVQRRETNATRNDPYVYADDNLETYTDPMVTGLVYYSKCGRWMNRIILGRGITSFIPLHLKIV